MLAFDTCLAVFQPPGAQSTLSGGTGAQRLCSVSIRVAVKGMSAANRTLTLDGDHARNCEKGRWFFPSSRARVG